MSHCKKNPWNVWKTWYKACLDLLFPAVCTICRTHLADGAAPLLCADCRAEVRFIQSPLCPCCGIPFMKDTGEDRLCGGCLRKKPPYTGARSLGFYSPPISTLIHRIKYNSNTSSLQILSELAKCFDFTFFHNSEVVIPVPLHRRKLQTRGLNQSLLLARIFFNQSSPPISTGALIRVRDTVPQTGLPKAIRKHNLRAAFAIKKQEDIKERRICLVDDVLTTGATVNECCKTLLQAGAKEVKVLTMARVPNNSWDIKKKNKR